MVNRDHTHFEYIRRDEAEELIRNKIREVRRDLTKEFVQGLTELRDQLERAKCKLDELEYEARFPNVVGR